MTKGFLDSYALIEILQGNPAYNEISQMQVLTSKVNLIELAYHLIQSFPELEVERILNSLKIETIEIDANHISKIAFFRKQFSSKKFSYIDCIGYILARENDLKFITGDKQFKDMPNVLFIK